MGLKGYRLWVMCQLDSTCRAPPRFQPLRTYQVGENPVFKPLLFQMQLAPLQHGHHGQSQGHHNVSPAPPAATHWSGRPTDSAFGYGGGGHGGALHVESS
jgi:hypothetical protein